MIDITDGFTGIAVAADELLYLGKGAFEDAPSRERSSEGRHPSGARVTVEFFRSTPLSPDREVRLCYDFADNGRRREIVGTPRLTHTTTSQCQPGLRYHYRISHWITASSLMRFIPDPGDAAAARGGPGSAMAIRAAAGRW
jgi:hypothetical protein